MCLGASNVSFGLPRRHVLNAGFLPMAMAAGLTSAIMSTAEVCVDAVRAADLLLGHDAWGSSWIAEHRRRVAAEKETAAACMSTPAPRRRELERDEDLAPEDGARRIRLRFLPDGGEVRVPSGHAGVRRRELERDRDRLDLRRPRDVQEVQGARRLRRRADLQRRPAGLHRPASCAKAGGWPAAPTPARTW